GVGGPDHFDGAHFTLTGCGTPPVLGQIGDTVYCDTNTNGVQDAGEPGIPGVRVTLVCRDAAGVIIATATAITDANGKYLFINVPAGSCTVTVDASTVPAPCNNPGPCAPSVDRVLGAGEIFLGADFCFTPAPPEGPGTGTPGYWKNHPEAWPVDSIVIGGITYSKAEAIAWMKKPEKGDKTLTVFRHLVSAKLNVLIGNESSCISADIATADAWMAVHPVGSKVGGGSAAWAEISGVAGRLDDYNNGRLCAPHRN
ncbi:MAG TPA: SdrD B-like domain-containing protein, partial [Verrucomicrobiae bacterium]|nr:SdrD B-like domain-containing protein [Verrucomicrobiae bacterium]